MKVKDKTELKKSKKISVSKTLNAVALVVAVLGIASLANNIYLFRQAVNQYVAQGYSAATVTKQLLSSQLLPGIFEPIALYGGISIVLLAVSMINRKVSKCLELLTPAEVCHENISNDINAASNDVETGDHNIHTDDKESSDDEEKHNQLQASEEPSKA
ncbi:hypothetical protein [Clostridium autoethanogenum]|uniref:TRAG family protein n=1 Tax=Clostridium autoethanogenum DSM 10061 TaxID=1341692 RepID=A0ABM5P007_9CLOT|nr:hypothetical protein [Clostridium autoethanogenum]AGY78146.1 hypothetical protein CAETHG_3945 [Clostridium autoethanogenum DSM 10061]ALU38279.1 Hypothetical protein CLAU_3852 [Clostridium autoethanogenum DSM 10061]OVY51042.1 hypothetical protein WX72_02204 [Clostridium autoethanogenum]DAD54382.1 TPA_exp: hypothetical protein CAETHG_RS19355 [Clostridium autoethanogenum DSM 10061]